MLQNIRSRVKKPQTLPAFDGGTVSYQQKFYTIENDFGVGEDNPYSKLGFQQFKNTVNAGVGTNTELSPAALRYAAFQKIEGLDPEFALTTVLDDNTEMVLQDVGALYAMLRYKMDSFVFVPYSFWTKIIQSALQCTDRDPEAKSFRDRFLGLREPFLGKPNFTEWEAWYNEHILIKLPVTNISMFCQFPQLRIRDGYLQDVVYPFCPPAKVQIYIKSSVSNGKSYQKRLFGSKRFLIDYNKQGYFNKFESNPLYQTFIVRFTNYIYNGKDEDETIDFSLAGNLASYELFYERFIKDEKQSLFNKITSFVEQIISLQKSVEPGDQARVAALVLQLKALYDCEKEKNDESVDDAAYIPFKDCLRTTNVSTKLGKKITAKKRARNSDGLACDEYEKYYTTGTKLGLTQGSSIPKKVIVTKRDRTGLGTVSKKYFFACKPASKGGASKVLTLEPENKSMYLNQYVAAVMNKEANNFMKQNDLFRSENGRVMHKLASTYTLLTQEQKQDLYKIIKRQVLLGRKVTLSTINPYLTSIGVAVQKETLNEFDLNQRTDARLRALFDRAQGSQIPITDVAEVPGIIKATQQQQFLRNGTDLIRILAANQAAQAARARR